MEGQSSNDGQLAHMHTILRIARDLKETTSQKSDTFRNLPLHASSATSVSDVNLPSPPSILPALLSTGADYKTSISVNQKYQLRAEEFRKNAQDSIINATRKLAELPSIGGSTPEKLLAKTTAAFTQVYLGKLENWKEEVISLVKHHTQLRPSAKTSKDSRGFNNAYIPLLEHFFEENPFPSHADKAFLAQKSNMQYKQIHVWFQNRRNRTRKEGKTLRRKPMSEGAILPLDDLRHKMRYVAEGKHPMAKSSATHKVPPQAPRNVLETYSPPCHCFPAPYTSHSRVTSEMKRIDQGFFDASWLLRKSSTAVSRTSPCDMDELSERFSQLSVRGEGSFRHHSEPAHHPLQPPAATASYIIQTCSAPHPALIRRPIIPQHSPARRYLANAAASTSQFISPHKFSYPSFGTVKRRSILAREKCRRIVSSSQWQAAQPPLSPCHGHTSLKVLSSSLHPMSIPAASESFHYNPFVTANSKLLGDLGNIMHSSVSMGQRHLTTSDVPRNHALTDLIHPKLISASS